MSDGCDPLDIASERETEFRERAIKAVRDKLTESHPDFDGKRCVECAALIPVGRLRMGKVYCVACQEVRERASKFFRR